MKIHVVVNSRSEVIATVAITPITVGNKEGIVGVDPLPDQTVYELEIPEAEVSKNLSELYQKCDLAIKSGAAKKVASSNFFR
jgi:hydroxymethylpyrimidine/phosphomethylpyrimidine kinase